jgi:hypothetical protein
VPALGSTMADPGRRKCISDPNAIRRDGVQAELRIRQWELHRGIQLRRESHQLSCCEAV